jgi:hypothetical protein
MLKAITIFFDKCNIIVESLKRKIVVVLMYKPPNELFFKGNKTILRLNTNFG